MARIRKGDQVILLSGKDRGKTGKVLQVWPARDRALVERLNMVKHFDRRTQENQAGGVIEREGALALSKISLLCPKCRKPSRTGWKILQDGTKQRICQRCQGVVA